MPDSLSRFRSTSAVGTPIKPIPRLPSIPDAMKKLPGVAEYEAAMQKWHGELEEWRKELSFTLGANSV